MPPPVKVQLIYDITSPWSYIGYEALCRYREAWNLKLQLRPAFLGGVLTAAKNIAPASVPNKAAWLPRDIQILSEIYSLNMRLPEGFPFSVTTVYAIRFLRVLRDQHPELLEPATKRLWVEFFEKLTPSRSPAFLESLTPSILSKDDFTRILAESNSPANKEGLKTDAEQLANEEGVFGMPWIIVERADGAKESFFGSDRMMSISWWLGVKDYPYDGPSPRKSPGLTLEIDRSRL